MTVDTSIDGAYGDVEMSRYHADPTTLSASGAKLLLPPSTPAKFKWQRDHPPAPKPHFDFGHVAHKLVLGEGDELAILDPALHGLKKDGTVADNPAATAGWKEAVANARVAGEVPIHVDDYNKAVAMAQAVGAHPEAARLFEEGDAEISLYAQDPNSGVRLRGRADWITQLDGRLIIVDFKTAATANPQEFARAAANYSYHIQAAWYRRLAQLLELDASPAFVFVVAEKDAPHLVSVVEFDAEAMAEGERLMRKAIQIFARCVETKEWPGYGTEITPISLPYWAIRNTQPTIGDLVSTGTL